MESFAKHNCLTTVICLAAMGLVAPKAEAQQMNMVPTTSPFFRASPRMQQALVNRALLAQAYSTLPTYAGGGYGLGYGGANAYAGNLGSGAYYPYASGYNGSSYGT